jgi:hypothetical protein
VRTVGFRFAVTVNVGTLDSSPALAQAAVAATNIETVITRSVFMAHTFV